MSEEKRNVLVTGGAGFVGSHTCVELLQNGYQVTVVDNLDNASSKSLSRVREICGCAEEDLRLVVVDLLDREALEEVFKQR